MVNRTRDPRLNGVVFVVQDLVEDAVSGNVTPMLQADSNRSKKAKNGKTLCSELR